MQPLEEKIEQLLQRNKRNRKKSFSGPRTVEEFKKICEMYQSGEKLITIARTFHCSDTTIRENLKRLGVYGVSPFTSKIPAVIEGVFVGLKLSGKLTSEISALTGFSENIIDGAIVRKQAIVREYMRGALLYEDMTWKIHTMEDFDSRRRASNSPRFCYDVEMKKDIARIRRRVVDLDSPED